MSCTITATFGGSRDEIDPLDPLPASNPAR
jgi:hypothetical protein